MSTERTPRKLRSRINLDLCDDFTQGYVECALWASIDEQDPETGDGPPMDQEHDWTDIAQSSIADMILDCVDFQRANALLLESAYDLDASYSESRAGHDFWLTRNGHGAGYWDRGLGEVGDKLTEASKPYGSCDLYKSDGEIHAQ